MRDTRTIRTHNHKLTFVTPTRDAGSDGSAATGQGSKGRTHGGYGRLRMGSKYNSLRARAGLCSMSNTSPKFVDHAYSGSQTRPCSHRAVAICARVLGSAPNLCRSRPPERTPPCANRARRGFFCTGWSGLRG
jgi:hypothetical protein